MRASGAVTANEDESSYKELLGAVLAACNSLRENGRLL